MVNKVRMKERDLCIVSNTLTGELVSRFLSDSGKRVFRRDWVGFSEICGDEILFFDAEVDGIFDILRSEKQRFLFSQFFSCILFNVRRSKNVEIPAIQAGFRGLYYQDVILEQILNDLPYLMRGGVQLPKQLLFEALHQETSDLEKDLFQKNNPMTTVLTKREADILFILSKGATNKDIGEALLISEATVKRHLSNIYDKTGIHNRRLLVESFYGEKM